MAQVPFAARALVGTIPPPAMVDPVTITSLLDDFCSQFEDLPTRVENLMQTGHNTFIVHCYTRVHAEELAVSGLTYRTHLIVFKPASNTQWVKLTRVRYGITENAIKSRLSDFGTVLKIRQEKIRGIGISAYSVKIELQKPIPSRITVAQSPVNVFYRGQISQCFRCEQTGHLARNCPMKKSTSATVTTSATVPVTTSATVSSVPVTTSATVSSAPFPPATSTITTSATISLPIVNNALISRSPIPTALPTDVPPPLPVATMDSTPSVSSASSGLTPLKDGKRMPKDGSLAPPAKRDKVVPSYVDYDRDRTRCLLLVDDLTPEDLQASSDLTDRIPLDVMRLYRLAYAFNHPSVVLPDALVPVQEDFLHLAVPSRFADYLPDPCQPVLPDLAPCSTSYQRYVLLQNQWFAAKQSPYIQERVDLHLIEEEVDAIPDELVHVYLQYYCLSHPELLSNLEDDEHKLLYQRWTDRDFTSLY